MGCFPSPFLQSHAQACKLDRHMARFQSSDVYAPRLAEPLASKMHQLFASSSLQTTPGANKFRLSWSTPGPVTAYCLYLQPVAMERTGRAVLPARAALLALLMG
jgi:hypothetical protein